MDAVRRRVFLLIAVGCAGVALVVPSGASAAVGGTIQGTLVDDTGSAAPLVGVCVFVLDENNSMGVISGPTPTDGTGSYSTTVPPGTYKVFFTNGFGCPTGGDPVTNEFYMDKDQSDFGNATLVPVADGATVTVDAVLHRLPPPTTGTIGGTLTSRTGAPLDQVCVGVLDNAEDLVAGGFTSPSGVYTVSNLAPGSYRVIFITDQPACPVTSPNPVVTEYYNDQPTFATANPVSVVAGQTTPANATLALVDDPVANDDAATVGEDSPATSIPVLTNDTDDDGDTILITNTTDPANGSVAVIGGGTGLTYTPDADYCNGGSPLDTFVYTVSGGDTATVSVTVTCSPDDPELDDDAFSVAEDSGATQLDVLTNDSDADGDALEIISVGTPVHGTASVVQGSPDEISYTPNANFCGSDNFLYQVGGETATVVVNISCSPDDPTAADDSKAAVEDSNAAANTYTVLSNDTDPDAGTAFNITAVSDPANGTAAIVDAGPGADKVSYAPDANYCNDGAAPDDTFTYTVDDGTGRTDTATVSVAVSCTPDDPDAVADSQTAVEDSTAGTNQYPVLSNDTDPDAGTAFNITAVSDPANGTAAIVDAGPGADKVSYAPDANYCNDGAAPDDTFTYTVDDGTGRTDTATVSVAVTCVDDRTTAVDDTKSVGEDAGATSVDVRANDNDIDSPKELVTARTNGAHGTVTVTNGGVDVSYTPNANYCGADSFTYTLAGGDTADVSVTVTCVEDAAFAFDDGATVSEDSGANTINVRANDADPDASNDLVTAKTNGAHGAVAITNGGADVSYTPDANYCGADSFTYTVSGGDSANVAVTVTCVEDNPVAVNDSKTVAEDSGATTIDVLTNDTDVDAGSKTVAAKTNGANGAVAIGSGGSDVSYAPDADFCGNDSFTYSLNGGSTATVAVTVTCVDDPIPGPGPDTQAPDVRFTSGPSGKTKDTTPTFAFSSNDSTARFTCSVDGKPGTACTSPFTTTKLKKGKHTFTVTATDAAGNANSASQSFTVKKKKKRSR